VPPVLPTRPSPARQEFSRKTGVAERIAKISFVGELRVLQEGMEALLEEAGDTEDLSHIIAGEVHEGHIDTKLDREVLGKEEFLEVCRGDGPVKDGYQVATLPGHRYVFRYVS
jgi:hypothetical protein